MCGIYGIVRLSEQAPPIDEAALARMAGALAHRGGDGEARFADDFAALGLTRLAIVGPREPAQVFWDAGRRHVAVMNGEIFNHGELRAQCGDTIGSACDTALLPALLARHGEQQLARRLVGEYAMAIYTPAHRRLLLLRDRLGVKPLFLARWDDLLFFASEPRAIIASGIFPPRLDRDAAAHALSHGALPEDLHLVHGLVSVPPGHSVDVRDGKLTTTRYWSPRENPWTGDIDDLTELTREVISLRSRAEVPVAAALSGGLDSSLVTTVGRPNLAAAYTLAVPGRDESGIAESTAKRLSLTHVKHVPEAPTLTSLRETMAALGAPDARLFGAAAVVAQLARRLHADGFRVAIGGEGADELFLGYPWHHLQAAAENVWPLRHSPHDPTGIDLARAHAAVILRQGGAGSALDDWLLAFDGQGRTRAEELCGALLGVEAPARRRLASSGAYARQDTSLTRDMLAGPVRIADRMWMQHAVELRTPYLDHRLVEAVTTLDPDLLESASEDKPVLRAIAARLAPNLEAPVKQGLAGWARPAKADIMAWSTATLSEPTLTADPTAARQLLATAATDEVALHVLWHALVLEVAARPLFTVERA